MSPNASQAVNEGREGGASQWRFRQMGERIRMSTASAMTGPVPHQRFPYNRRSLSFGERGLDLILAPLEPGKVTYMESTTSFVFEVIRRLVMRALSETDGTVVFVDGCNRMDPYGLVGLCKRFRIDPRDALGRMIVARAFTAYQMSSIIEEKLAEKVPGSRLLVVSGIQYPYQDTDVGDREARVLLTRANRLIYDLARDHFPVTVVTDIRRHGRRDFRSALVENCDRHLFFAFQGRRIRIHDIHAGIVADYVQIPLYQTLIDDFTGGSKWLGRVPHTG